MVSQPSESTALFSTDVSTDCLAQRLDDYRAVIASPPVDIVDPTTLNHQELAKLRERVAVANFAHYRCAQAVNDTAVLALCHQVGLKNLHQSVVTAGLTKIEVRVPEGVIGGPVIVLIHKIQVIAQ